MYHKNIRYFYSNIITYVKYIMLDSWERSMKYYKFSKTVFGHLHNVVINTENSTKSNFSLQKHHC